MREYKLSYNIIEVLNVIFYHTFNYLLLHLLLLTYAARTQDKKLNVEM